MGNKFIALIDNGQPRVHILDRRRPRGGRAINIFVYTPKTAETQKLLCERTAEIHAAAVLAKLEKLSCSKEQKLRLLDEIKKAARQIGAE